MKRIIYIAIALITLAFTSCEKEDVGGTATQAMSGDWVMTFTDGTNSWTAPHALTFNTSANLPDEIWVSDAGGFWDFQVKAACDQSTMTFQTDGWAQNVAYDCKVRITNGKISFNSVTLPSGRVVDGISYDIEFDDDEDAIVWHATGRRYTGFAEDN